MKPITVYTGPSRSGKTRRAIEIASQKESYFFISARSGMRMFDHPFLYHGVTSKTELIIFDDVPERDLHEVISMFRTGTIIVNTMGARSQEIERPEVIITCECNGVDFDGIYGVEEEFFGDEYNPVKLITQSLELSIGDDFIRWADGFFSVEKDFVVSFSKEELYDSYVSKDISRRRTCTPTFFKVRLKKYCKLRGLAFNPNREERWIKGGKEYFKICNLQY